MNQLPVTDFIDQAANATEKRRRGRRNGVFGVFGVLAALAVPVTFGVAAYVYNGEATEPLTDTELEACAENNLIARQTNGADLSTLSLGAIATEVQACDMDPNIGQPHKAFDEYLVIAERVNIP